MNKCGCAAIDKVEVILGFLQWLRLRDGLGGLCGLGVRVNLH